MAEGVEGWVPNRRRFVFWWLPVVVAYYSATANNTKILLMAEILHHLGCMKPYKYWDKLPTSTGAGFQPSTVVKYLNPKPEFRTFLTISSFSTLLVLFF